jgi:RNA polymerase sigma factor (sigma-70 family)
MSTKQRVVRQQLVFCVRCDHQYLLGFDSRGHAIDPRCDAAECGWDQWSCSCRAEVERLCATHTAAVWWAVLHYILPRFPAGSIEALGGKEELAAEGMVVLLHAARLYDSKRISAKTGRPVCFKSYLVRSVVNRVRQYITREIRFKRAASSIAPFEGELSDAKAFDPADTSAQKELLRHLDTKIAKLGLRRRRVLELTVMEGRTLADAGRALGTTTECVRQNRKMALTQLRKMFGEIKAVRGTLQMTAPKTAG